MRRIITALAIFLALLLLPFLVRYFTFNQLGSGEHTPPPPYEPANSSALVPTPPSAPFADTPTNADTLILLDRAHNNSFTLEEINYLDGRLAARGSEFLLYEGGDLANLLRTVNAFVVIAPLEPFDDPEIQAVRHFVAQGGKLLLIGDPSRFEQELIRDDDGFPTGVQTDSDQLPLNSLANTFNIIYNRDYLYNTIENEGNFRNIILQGFSESSPITAELEQIALYGSHSVQVGDEGRILLEADDNTWSSATDRAGGLALGVSAIGGQVIALGDVDFLRAPYFTVFDNSQFIAQLADFLTGTRQREFVLGDFPYFYGESVDLIYSNNPDLGPDAFDEVIALQNGFAQTGRQLHLAVAPQADHDALWLGLYNQSEDVAELLATAGISMTIQPPVLTEQTLAELAEENDEDTDDMDAEPSEPEETIQLLHTPMGNVQMAGTALIYLHEAEGQQQLLILSASKEGLEATVERFLAVIPADAEAVLSDCLLQETLALCPTNVSDEVVEAELDSGGVPEQMEAPTDEETDEDEVSDEGEEGDASGETDGDEGGSDETNGDEGETGDSSDVEVDYSAIGADPQGEIGLDETVVGALAEEESHAWLIAGISGYINVVLETDDETADMVLTLYSADGEEIRHADAGFTSEGEQIYGVEMPANNVLVAVVHEFDDGAVTDYTLTLSESAGQGGVFIFSDDDGEALDSGFTSAGNIVDLLGDDYDITLWVASEEDDLTPEDVAGHKLLIWTSGDYQTENLFTDADATTLFDVFFSTEGVRALIVGSAPVLFLNTGLAPISDLEIVGDHPVLLDGFEDGDVITLDGTYEAILLDVAEEDLEEEDIPLFTRGAESDSAGTFAGFASANSDDDSFIAILGFPFSALPAEVQALLLDNLMAWFEME